MALRRCGRARKTPVLPALALLLAAVMMASCLSTAARLSQPLANDKTSVDEAVAVVTPQDAPAASIRRQLPRRHLVWCGPFCTFTYTATRGNSKVTITGGGGAAAASGGKSGGGGGGGGGGGSSPPPKPPPAKPPKPTSITININNYNDGTKGNTTTVRVLVPQQGKASNGGGGGTGGGGGSKR